MLTKDLELQASTADDEFPTWDPREFGLPQATLVAILLVAGIIAFSIWISTAFGPKPVPQAIQVTQATLTQLPKPTPPPPPKVVPPPKPVPAVIPKPPPVQSHIAVAIKPPPPIRHTGDKLVGFFVCISNRMSKCLANKSDVAQIALAKFFSKLTLCLIAL